MNIIRIFRGVFSGQDLLISALVIVVFLEVFGKGLLEFAHSAVGKILASAFTI